MPDVYDLLATVGQRQNLPLALEADQYVRVDVNFLLLIVVDL